MVGIQGLGGVPEPKSERTAKARNERETAANTAANATSGANAGAQDRVAISSAAEAAAELTRLIGLAKDQADIRTDRVEAARQNLANGSYKNPEVVEQVAERLLKYLS